MKHFLASLLLLISVSAQGTELSYYLPQDVTYDPSIPTPESVLGYQVGDWHVRHDQLVSYFKKLAEVSPRFSVEEMGRSHEQRPLLLVKVSAPSNIENLESVRKYHISGVKNGHVNDQPVIIWMGYSVHGNEPSGANASLLLAYYLAAAQGEQINDLLNNAVILIEPAINPDGISRFAQWVNTHKSKNLVADPNNREHNEQWPSGRTNHYWFDLNRDWLLLTHPESRARINQFHRWKPNVLTDFHEMGTHSTYFFQPGIPSRKNPLTPEKNVQLTQTLANYHARALDNIGSLYFTEESFDDFYAGKGSTYPDLQGSIGILFEQGSSRGHLQESINGDLAFPFTIKNQFVTSLSSLQGALAHKAELLNYQNKFFSSALSDAKKDDFAGYILTESEDKQRLFDLLKLLSQHQIMAYKLTENVEVSDREFKSSDSYFIPLQQPQYRLIKSIFSTRKSFPDNTFYDVSSWNLAYAFNIDFTPVKRSLWKRVKTQQQAWKSVPAKINNPITKSYAYAFKWQQYQSPKLLSKLLQQGIKVRAALKPFRVMTQRGNQAFKAGSIVIPATLQTTDNYVEIISNTAAQYGIDIYTVNSGLTAQGIDLGSRLMMPVELPQVAIIGGKGISQYEVGELWHYLDTRLALPASVIEQRNVSRLDLSRYTHLVLVNGLYHFNAKTTQKIVDWVKQGGVIIGQKSGTKWLVKNDLLSAEFLSSKDYHASFETDALTYADREALSAKKRIAGAVFEYQLDNSHPLTFGFNDASLAGFKNSNAIMLKSELPFINVATYSKKPLLAGYASKENVELIKQTAAIIAHREGKGRVIGFVDNLNFRGVWRGTSHLMANSLFFADAIAVKGD